MVEALGKLLSDRNDGGLLTVTGHSFLEEMISGKYDVIFEQHVLGFWYAKIGETKSGTVRLHLWPQKITPRAPEWTVHSHRFQLDSFVLAGSVANKVYAVTDSEEGTFRLYEVVYEDLRSYRRKTDRIVNCTELQSVLLQKGSFYRIALGEFHETVVSSTLPAATLVLTRNNSEEFPLVVGALNGDELYNYGKVFVDKGDVASLVRQLLTRRTLRL